MDFDYHLIRITWIYPVLSDQIKNKQHHDDGHLQTHPHNHHHRRRRRPDIYRSDQDDVDYEQTILLQSSYSQHTKIIQSSYNFTKSLYNMFYNLRTIIIQYLYSRHTIIIQSSYNHHASHSRFGSSRFCF